MLMNARNRTIEDAYLFDRVAAVKVEKFFFVFFQRPLVTNNFATYLNYTNNTQDRPNPDVTAWDWRLYKTGLQCFAVNGSDIYRYDYTFDSSMTEHSVSSYFVNYGKFTGKEYTVAATPKEVVIACGDCEEPGVYFFDPESLTLFDDGFFPIANPSKRKLHLAVQFTDAIRQTKVVVGSSANVDIIMRQTDPNGIEHFDVTKSVFVSETPLPAATNVTNATVATIVTDNSVSVGIGPQFLVLKQHD